MSDTDHECILYDRLDGGKVKCHVCNHQCSIKAGETGKCGVRLNRDGKLVSLVYGRPTSVSMDCIEKKPLYHFLPGTEILSIGTVGCNFRCSFCQNWTTSQVARSLKQQLKQKSKPQDLLETQIEDLTSHFLLPQELVNIALKRGVPSIAYTYNEPTIFLEYALDTMKLGKPHGIRHVFVSNGFESEETMRELQPFLDGINVDLKSFSNNFYTRLCGGKLQPVLETIKRSWEMGILTEVTTLLIEGENDSNDELTNIAQFLSSVSHDLPWHISAAHPAYEMQDINRTSDQTLRKAARIGDGAGLRYIYTGNTRERTHSNTRCPSCKETLVSRDMYRGVVQKLDTEKGTCGKCGTPIYGVWK